MSNMATFSNSERHVACSFQSPISILQNLQNHTLTMFTTETGLTLHSKKEHPTSARRHSVVSSWLLDLDGCEIDERTHGFIFFSKISPSDRTELISEQLGSRMWCDLDTAFINPEDFEPDLYDTVHFVDA